MIMAQGDYLSGTYSRVGTEENPGTYFGGGAGGGTSQTMPPKVKKVWVLTKGIWDNFGKWMKDGVWRMIQTIFSTDNIWRDNFVWYNDLKFKF